MADTLNFIIASNRDAILERVSNDDKAVVIMFLDSIVNASREIGVKEGHITAIDDMQAQLDAMKVSDSNE